MVTFEYVITDKAGIHARPAGGLVQASVKLDSSVAMVYEGKEANCKNLLSLMRLGVKHGSLVEFRVEGDSEEADALVLEAVVTENL